MPSKAKAKKKMPESLAAELAITRERVARSEQEGQFETYWHTTLKRLEKAAAQYESED